MIVDITCDVLIVGAGPAGSVCAKQLIARGLSVIVVDKSAFPRDKVCAGWITPAIIEMTGIDIGDYSKSRHCHPIYGFHTGLINKPGFTNHYDHVVSYSIRRSEFDHYLLDRCGARTILGEAVKSIQRDGRQWLVNGHITASMLIGAGGYFCPVAKFLGAKVGKTENAIRAQEIEFTMTPEQLEECQVSSEIPELSFCNDLKGYGWCVRKGDVLNIGLGREDPHRLSEHVAQYVDLLKSTKRISQSVPDKFHGHAYLTFGQSPRKLVDDAVLLIGDAGGLAYGRSGEGIRTAVESGIVAAQVVADSNGKYSREHLLTYDEKVNQRYGKKDYDKKPGIFSPVRHSIGKVILSNRYLSRQVVLNNWFLHTKQSPLELS